MAFELIQDFQYTNTEMEIMSLPKGTKIEKKVGDHYIFHIRKKEYRLDKRIVENNPLHFKKVDLTTQIQEILKKNKNHNSPKLAKIVVEFIETVYMSNMELVDLDILETMLNACRLKFKETQDDKWLIPLKELNWGADADGVFKN